MTTDQWVNRCLIVPAEYVSLARALCSGLTPSLSGSGMLTVPMSKTGFPPTTYFISHGMIKQEFADLLPLTTFDENGSSTNTGGQPEAIAQMAQGAASLDQINALLSSIDVTEQDPFVAMQRLGLKMIQEEL